LIFIRLDDYPNKLLKLKELKVSLKKAILEIYRMPLPLSRLSALIPSVKKPFKKGFSHFSGTYRFLKYSLLATETIISNLSII
jgi:hypothetical protein